MTDSIELDSIVELPCQVQVYLSWPILKFNSPYLLFKLSIKLTRANG